MKTTAADVIVTSSWRMFVVLCIQTHQGVIGVGDGTLNGRELTVASNLSNRRTV